MYDELFVIGDSYTTPGMCVNIEDSYWKKFQNLISAREVINYSHPGKSNFDMCRNALRYHLQNKDKKVFYLIGFSHVFRTETHNEKIENGINKNNGNLSELHIHPLFYKDNKLLTIYSSYEQEMVNFYTQSILLYRYLEQANVDFILHNCGKEHSADMYLPLVKDFVQEYKTLVKFPNLYHNTYLSINENKGVKPVDFDQYQWLGHHGSEGNHNYFLYLRSVYKNLY